MSVIATAVRHLMAAGVTGEALLAAIAEMEAEVRGEPKPRSSAAIRQERYRRNKASRVTESDACDAPFPLPLPSPTPPTNPRPHTPVYNTPARKGPVKPDGVSDQIWADFLTLRKRKKADLTETALAGIRREAEKAGWGLEAALTEAVLRGWTGFKSDWVAVDGKPQAPPGGVDPLMKSILAHRAKTAAPT